MRLTNCLLGCALLHQMAGAVRICNSEYGCCEGKDFGAGRQSSCKVGLTQQSITLPQHSDGVPYYSMQYAQSFVYTAPMLNADRHGGVLAVKQNILAGSGWTLDFPLSGNKTDSSKFMIEDPSTMSGYLTCYYGMQCKSPAGWVLRVETPTSTNATYYVYSDPDEEILVTFQIDQAKERVQGSMSIYGLSKDLNHQYNYTE